MQSTTDHRPTHRPIFFTIFGALALLIAAGAQAQSIEISPFVGVRYGGDVVDEFLDFTVDAEIDDGESYGGTVGFALNRSMQIELMWSHQDSALIANGGFLFPDETLFDIEVDYYHVGFLYQWAPGQVQPFIVLSLGVTELTPEPFDLNSETFPSGSLGGGVKVMFGEHVGVRLEGRVLSTVLDTSDDYFCDDFGCDSYGNNDDWLTQTEARAGLLFRF